MTETVSKKLIETHWNGKYEVYELKQFCDDRGMVCETFRLDDEILKDSKMCYVSETKPFVMRGPHEHGWLEKEENGIKFYGGQTDFFVSWKTQMVYQMYNSETNEFKYFVTDPDKFYLVKVAPPIIHSYRNVSLKTSMTLNYPTSFFMGEGKKDQIDEIRHEEKFEKNDVIVVFGAKGRLGKALVEELYNNIEYHKYDVIPFYDKLTNIANIEYFFEQLKKQLKDRKGVFINCAAATNVQEIKEGSNLNWSNVYLPKELAYKCEQIGINFIQFSTDYVFQETKKYNVSLSPYTRSKILMEKELSEIPFRSSKVCILRVANLFSDKEDDTHNIINKFCVKINNNEQIKIDPRIIVCPTDVKCLAKKLIPIVTNNELLFTDEAVSFINVIPEETFTLKQFIKEFFNYDNVKEEEGLLEPWFDSFNKGRILKVSGSKVSIINTIRKITQKEK